MPSLFWKTLRLTALPLVCLLAALPAPAAPTDAPSAPSQVAPVRPHKLFLKYVTSDTIIKRLGWVNERFHSFPDQSPHDPHLPDGVDRVYTLDGDNSLIIFATPDGFKLVKQIVESLDLAPREVSFRVIFVPASKAEVKQSELFSLRRVSTVAQAYDALMKKPRKVVDVTVTSTTGIAASLDVDALYRTWGTIHNGLGTPPESIPLPTDRMMEIIPRVNADDTISFFVTWPLHANISDPPVSQPDSSQVLLVTQTVQSGETLAMTAPRDIAGALTKEELHGDTMLIAFVTPTIIVDSNDTPKVPTAPVGPFTVSPAP